MKRENEKLELEGKRKAEHLEVTVQSLQSRITQLEAIPDQTGALEVLKNKLSEEKHQKKWLETELNEAKEEAKSRVAEEKENNKQLLEEKAKEAKSAGLQMKVLREDLQAQTDQFNELKIHTNNQLGKQLREIHEQEQEILALKKEGQIKKK